MQADQVFALKREHLGHKTQYHPQNAPPQPCYHPHQGDLPRGKVHYISLPFFPTPRFFFFINRRIHLCTRMTRGLCYFETFKAELSLVILCLTSQEVLLTLKPALLNGCVCPLLMCTSINKWCRCWQFLQAFIHISPLWPCKSKTTPKMEVCSSRKRSFP